MASWTWKVLLESVARSCRYEALQEANGARDFAIGWMTVIVRSSWTGLLGWLAGLACWAGLLELAWLS